MLLDQRTLYMQRKSGEGSSVVGLTHDAGSGRVRSSSLEACHAEGVSILSLIDYVVSTELPGTVHAQSEGMARHGIASQE